MIATINTRLQEFFDTLGISRREFARRLDVQVQNVYNYLEGRVPSVEFVQRLLETYDRLDAEWLLTGRGEMMRPKEEKGGTELRMEALERENKLLREEIAVKNSQIGRLIEKIK